MAGWATVSEVEGLTAAFSAETTSATLPSKRMRWPWARIYVADLPDLEGCYMWVQFEPYALLDDDLRLTVRLDGQAVTWVGVEMDGQNGLLLLDQRGRRKVRSVDAKRTLRRSAQGVLNKVLQASSEIEITMPWADGSDPVFRWSLEGAAETIAAACPGR